MENEQIKIVKAKQANIALRAAYEAMDNAQYLVSNISELDKAYKNIRRASASLDNAIVEIHSYIDKK